jgi:hypothetical protein
MVEAGRFRLADEVRYIQRRAVELDGRIVAVGQLVLFSTATATGDAWLLDRSDLLAARIARDGESEPVHIEDTDTAFTIGWTGRYRIDGPAFVYSDRDSGRVVTILGYPRLQAFCCDFALLFRCPTAAALATRDHLDALIANARTIGRRSLLGF